jgi:hypothetical protein
MNEKLYKKLGTTTCAAEIGTRICWGLHGGFADVQCMCWAKKDFLFFASAWVVAVGLDLT